MKITINMLHYIIRILALMTITSLPLNVWSGNKISFDGIDYDLCQSTILLDKENRYSSPFSVKTPEEAFARINAAGSKATLLVAPSVYWLDDPDDETVRSDKGGTPYAVRLTCDTLTIVGLCNKPEDVVFAVDRGQTQGAIGNFTMFGFSGSSLEVKNITFGNYCNVDLLYPANHDYDRKKRKDAIVQAQIGICHNTDRLFADNCRFISRLNLCPFVGARRSLYRGCYFECTDDALSGSAVYLDCRFKFFSSKPFYSTSETGAVFLNCDIESLCIGPQYFTKVPGPVVAIDTRFRSASPQAEVKWTRDASDITCRQLNISLNGSDYVIDSDRPQLGIPLTTSTLKDAYLFNYNGKKYYNLPNLLNGEDQWDPLGMNDLVAEAEKNLGRKLTRLPVALKMESDKNTLQARNDTAIIPATPLLWGGYRINEPFKSVYVSQNLKPQPQEVELQKTTDGGLSARLTLHILPNLKKAPVLKGKPKVCFDYNANQYAVSYNLSGKGEDESTIVWSRIADFGDDRKVEAIRHGKGAGADRYTAKAGDYGFEIVAVVFPKYKDSRSGAPAVSDPYLISDITTVDELPESRLSTDFSDIPIKRRPHGIPGTWSFDIFKPTDTAAAEWTAGDGAGWTYGQGFDASKGPGIFQSDKGARMSYTPARDICQNMSVSLTAEPAKSGGQGFGSATSQYMDICVKFNPENLDGYALRIERTPDHDRAVRFSLVRYENGSTSVIDPGVISNCFRSPCHISVSITDGMLRADAYTDASASTPCCPETLPAVHLSAPVADSTDTGFCIQHTGSTGPSSTLISDVEIKWD